MTEIPHQKCQPCIYEQNERSYLFSKFLQVLQVVDEQHPLPLTCGKSLTKVHVAYEIFGSMNAKKDNVILICHAFTGDSHVGTHPTEPDRVGWWGDFVGPESADRKSVV